MIEPRTGTLPPDQAASGAQGGRGQGGEAEGGADDADAGREMTRLPDTEKLCTSAVEHTRGHIARLREMVNAEDERSLYMTSESFCGTIVMA